MNHELTQALVSCDESKVKTLIKEQIESGISGEEIVSQCHKGMAKLGEMFSEGECFLPQLIVAGTIMKSVMDELTPLTKGTGSHPSVGKVVVGSVRNDIHDVGKQIVNMMLTGVGFEVIDLGVNVPPDKFVEAIQAHKPQVVGMSILLTTCYPSVIATTNAIKKAGLRQDISIMVGGAAASDLLAQNAECDFYGKTAVDGLRFAQNVVGQA